MKPGLIVLVLTFLLVNAYAQDSINHTYKLIRSTDLILGINWQGNTRDNKTYRYYEIGIGKGQYAQGVDFGSGGAVYISEEMYFGPNTIFGTKLGAWFHWMLDMGAAMVYYTDFDRGNLKIRPELGVGFGRVRAVIGYNIPTFNNKAFKELQQNNMQVCIQVALAIKKRE
jgi:hypothetical protein